MLIINSCNFLC